MTSGIMSTPMLVTEPISLLLHDFRLDTFEAGGVVGYAVLRLTTSSRCAPRAHAEGVYRGAGLKRHARFVWGVLPPAIGDISRGTLAVVAIRGWRHSHTV
jgi:hypothetical protein